MRIQKYLSQENKFSRRQVEKFIQNGWVFVNGQLAKIGQSINPDVDVITFAKEVDAITYIYIAFNKPRGVVTNCPKPGEKEIRDLLPEKYQHLNAVGRLDKASEGLILLTNDGVFTKKMLDHQRPHEREYEVWTDQPITAEMIDRLETGVFILSDQTKVCEVSRISERRFSIVLKEGKNRQIRRMVEVLGLRVTRLKRVRFGRLSLKGLKVGELKELNPEAV